MDAFPIKEKPHLCVAYNLLLVGFSLYLLPLGSSATSAYMASVSGLLNTAYALAPSPTQQATDSRGLLRSAATPLWLERRARTNLVEREQTHQVRSVLLVGLSKHCS